MRRACHRPMQGRCFEETDTTERLAGFCLGHAQTNVAILPDELSDDFEEFCKKNFGPLPLLYRSKAGEVGAPPLAADSNIRCILSCNDLLTKTWV